MKELDKWARYIQLGFFSKETAIQELQRLGYSRRKVCEEFRKRGIK